MAAAMVELTHQNQELRMEINLRRQTREECEGGGQTQSHDDRENIEIGSQLRGTTSRTVPHLKEEMNQMKKVMEEMKENMRRANPIEDLVHRIDSPFMAFINGHPLPSKFKLPSLNSYDGTRDPFDHIATFKTTMKAFGLRVHVYKFTFSAFFFFFFSHLLTLGDNFYCYEQCIHCSYTVHTLFTY